MRRVAEESFILVDLKSGRAKYLAKVLGSEACRKILERLAKGEGTESSLAKELDMPLSTVHYNMRLLREAGLVRVDAFHYSEKGKEVAHYSLENKYLVIAPKKKEEEGASVISRMKSFLPVSGLIVGGAYLAYVLAYFLSRPSRLALFSSGKVGAFSSQALVPEAAVPAAGVGAGASVLNGSGASRAALLASDAVGGVGGGAGGVGGGACAQGAFPGGCVDAVALSWWWPVFFAGVAVCVVALSAAVLWLRWRRRKRGKTLLEREAQ